ncbi:hypothetical protein [Armatimonas sp.]|uniref:hypothetical protein n=1 Tax=Armatimonas sp. TaxID=1872638 RepID=UPI0037514B38
MAEAKSAAAMLDWALEKADLTDSQRRQIIHAKLLVAQAELAREKDTLHQERRVEQEHLADEAARIGLVPPSELTLESLGITMTRALPPVESASGAYEVPALAKLLPSVAGIDLEDSKGKVLSVGAKKGFIEFLTEEAAPIVIGALIAIAFGVMIGLASPNSIRSGTVPIPMMVLLVLIGTTTACMLGRAAQGAIRNLVLALPLKERFANRIMLGVVALFFIGVFVGLGAETVIEGGALHELYSRFVGQRQALQGVVRKSAEPEVSAAVFYLMGACISLPYVIFKCNKAMQEALIGVNWARLYLVRLWDQRMSEAAMVVKSVLKVGELRREEDEATARITAIRERLEHLANVHTAEHIIEVKAERLYAAKAWFAFLEKLDQLVEQWDSDGRRPAARATAGRQVGFENVASHGANVMAALRRLFGGHSNELENRGGQ